MNTTPAMAPAVAQLLRDAVAAARANDRARAHALFREAATRDPGNEAAWLWFAHTAADPGDAVTGLRHALRLNPAGAAATALPTALVKAGVAAARGGYKTTAAGYLAEATTLDPGNVTAWLWLAGVTDDRAKAAGMLERVLRIDPDNAHARQGLAKLWGAQPAAAHCPLCGHQAAAVADACPACHAVVTLRRPELFDDRKRDLNRVAVEAAGRRLKAQWVTAPTAETAYGLALVFLNLGHVEEGRRAARLALQGRGLSAAREEELNSYLSAFDTVAVAAKTTPNLVLPATPAAAPVARTPGSSIRTATRPAAPPPPPRVMVVDDSATIRKTVAVTLSKAGYQVIEAADADEATRRLEEVGAPKLFVLDINMPGLDGFGLCKQLRAHADTAAVPVVFLTGKTGILSKLHGKWAGAADYLTKPFQPRDLLLAVAKIVPAPVAAPR